MSDHPLTDEMCEDLSGWDFYGCLNTEAEWNRQDMRAAADWQLEQVLEWLNFGYQTDPNLSREIKRSGRSREIAIALKKAMRPQQ